MTGIEKRLIAAIKFILKGKTVGVSEYNQTMSIIKPMIIDYSHEKIKLSGALHKYYHYQREEIRQKLSKFCSDYIQKNYMEKKQ